MALILLVRDDGTTAQVTLSGGITNISDSGVVTVFASGTGTTFADDAARNAATPAFIGQEGFQLDTNQLYFGLSISAGSWTSEIRFTNLAPESVYFRNSNLAVQLLPPTLSGSYDVTLPGAAGTLSTLDGTETLSNKTLVGMMIGSGGSILDPSENPYVVFISVGGAVNQITITNATAGNPASITATGTDTDVSLVLDAQGAGIIAANKQFISTIAIRLFGLVFGSDGNNSSDVASGAVFGADGSGGGIWFVPPITAQDTGWTANSDAGDKTVDVPAYTNGLNGTMVSALNLVSPGTGTALSAGFDQLVLVTKKFQATETALSIGLTPNL